ncbi:MAG: lipid-A-disaccharide synthase [Rhodospirillaceae bacterium]|nr:lipid-A-disaccharide synthase [Rhodospirillaceae bacterium]
MENQNHKPTVFIIAGEASGDALGANLIKALIKKTRGKITFCGVGGEKIENAASEIGMHSIFPMSELSVMGFTEVLPKIPNLLRRIKQTVQEIERIGPDVVVTIDAPDFVFRVAKKLKKRGSNIPIVHYVAPSVWAWRPGRAKKIAGFLDHLLCLLPFEPKYFKDVGLPATFVGHPVVESEIGCGDGDDFRQRHKISEFTPLLAVLPGSRMGEVSRLTPVFGRTLGLLKKTHPELEVVVVTLSGLRKHISAATKNWPVRVNIVGEDEKGDAFSACDAALAASGTVSLELALAQVPAVIAYRFGPLTAFLAKRLIKAKYANIVNLVLDRPAIPELLLDNCRPDMLAPEISKLLNDQNARTEQRKAYVDAMAALGYGTLSPGERSADVVLGVIANNLNK